ncbi:MAG TPA: CPBP family intramembrane glutamic endopeptidase [Pyrinomonadaceae bacterium]|nr:CPBP family intramembrane glutamic endopeptidase [Pyrinomonadaceae bacterium]
MSTPIEPVGPTGYADFAQSDTALRVVNPDDPPWGVLAGIGVWLTSFLLMVVFQVAFLLVYMVGKGVGLRESGKAIQSDPTAVLLQVVSLIPVHLLTLGVAWLLVTGLGKRPFLASLGWEWDARFTLWRSAGLAVVLLAVGFLIIYLEGNPQTPLDKVLDSSRGAALVAAFLATATAPFVEEVVYRGVIYSPLQRVVGAGWAIFLVAASFAAVHIPQYYTSLGVIFTIFMLSAVLTWVRAYTGKLLPCFVIHLVFNGIQSFFIVAGPYLERSAPHAPQPPPPDPALLALSRLFGLPL